MSKTIIYDHDQYIDPDNFKEEIEDAYGLPYDEIGEDEKYSWLYLTEEANYEDDKNWINECINGARLICVGTASVWNGSYMGGFITDSFDDALQEIRHNDMGDFAFYEEDREFHIAFTHHDGTHDLIARIITDDGEDFISDHTYDPDMTDQDMELTVFNDPVYSVPLRVTGNY